jgi:hypothetical protein
MNPLKLRQPGRVVAALLALFGIAAASLTCLAHDEHVHMAMTRAAWLSSDGLMVFLGETLGQNGRPFTNAPNLLAQPPPYTKPQVMAPEVWAEYGSYYEDMADTISLRSADHFYTVRPARIPGQAYGLTDSDETPFLGLWYDITNSFAWGTESGITGPHRGPFSAGTNIETWLDARNHAYSALTSGAKLTRDQQLALMLYSLGHVLHLNQDLSQPDHVRNDEHRIEKHRYIEYFGYNNYLKRAMSSPIKFAKLFPLSPRGWTSWRTNGFLKLLDFWDRGKYTNSSLALNLDAAGVPGQQLGLAEVSNGNYLGEDAVYRDYFATTDKHYFPFPSLTNSTDFPTWAGRIAPGVTPSLLINGRQINRVRIKKVRDGIVVTNHSMLAHSGAALLKKKTPQWVVSTTIEDDKVLNEYHVVLVPKAIEYSAGILDYFFRGRLTLSCLQVQAPNILFCLKNISGQPLKGGTVQLYGDDGTGLRAPIPLYPAWQTSDSLANGQSRQFSFLDPGSSITNYVVVFRGIIGTNATGAPLDPVDATNAIATTHFAPATPPPGSPPGARAWAVGGAVCLDGSCCTTPGQGEKHVIAAKAWHGRPGFNYSPDRTPAATTKYLTVSATASAGESGQEHTNDTVYSDSGSSYRTATVSRWTGKMTTGGADTGDQGWGAAAWCARVAGFSPATPSSLADQALEEFRNGQYYLPDSGSGNHHHYTAIRISTGLTELEIDEDDDNLTFTADWYQSCNGAWVQNQHVSASVSETSASYGSSESGCGGADGAWHTDWVTASAQLTDPYSWTDLNGDVDGLLGTWDLSKDGVWSNYCADGPFVTVNERFPTAPGFHELGWTDTSLPIRAASVADGAVVGAPVPPGTPAVDPSTGAQSPIAQAPQWFSEGVYGAGGAYASFPVGAWSDLNATLPLFRDYLVKAKWAEIKTEHASYNFFRPCGADRDARDAQNNLRFPNAWPICGQCGVASAASSGGIATIVLADPAPYLRTGDRVDFSGVAGLGANLQVTVASATQFSVPGTVSGPYSAGGYVNSHGAPDSWWNDESPKGDFVFIAASWAPSGYSYTCSQGNLLTKSCAPVVKCISPKQRTI